MTLRFPPHMLSVETPEGNYAVLDELLLWTVLSVAARVFSSGPAPGLLSVAEPGLLAAAFLGAEHRLSSTRALVVVARGLTSPIMCEVSRDQGSNLCPLHWPADSYPLCHQGSPPLPFSIFVLFFELPRGISSASCPLTPQGFLVGHFPLSFHLLTVREMHPQFLELCSVSY
ncbi:unnamed protein product [Rangifer tarandus platyrhynchus]|uniref:Uncharacterized protein n=1 Tax=Rangifer tarandus platyrhynchus TaxID=3082113 RepID=A0ABN8YGD4_RANTA|nr:unnamed protein product [Rangifer tarandus platyrhynchus]